MSCMSISEKNSFGMKPDIIKETLLEDLNQYMEVIDRLPLLPKSKLMSLSR